MQAFLREGMQAAARTSSGQSAYRSPRPNGQGSLHSLAPPLPKQTRFAGLRLGSQKGYTCGLSSVFSEAHVLGKNGLNCSSAACGRQNSARLSQQNLKNYRVGKRPRRFPTLLLSTHRLIQGPKGGPGRPSGCTAPSPPPWAEARPAPSTSSCRSPSAP